MSAIYTESKVTNIKTDDRILTSVMKSYIFQVSLIVFKDFSRLFDIS